MQLEKWYADIVDGDDVHVLYKAALRLGPLTVAYAGRIRQDGRAVSRYRLGPPVLPTLIGEQLRWPGAAGEQPLCWHIEASPVASNNVLHAHGGQELSWWPLVLNAPVSGAGLRPGARGYVERLRMNFSPWKLGLKRLKWGRFCGARHSVVWIEWEGERPRQLLLLDGHPVPLARVSTEQVIGGGLHLHWAAKRVLVDEPLDQGALKGMPLAQQLAGVRFLQGIETKWMAQAELTLGGDVADRGAVIFEEVRWA